MTNHVKPLSDLCFIKQSKTTTMEIKTNNMQADSNSNLLLTGVILFANMDYSSFLDYGIKAMIGGFIWMGFKLTADYFSEKLKGK
jgi:hypothetical protein